MAQRTTTRGRGPARAGTARVAARRPAALVLAAVALGGLVAVPSASAGGPLTQAVARAWQDDAKSPAQLGQAVVGPWTTTADPRVASSRLPGDVGGLSVRAAEGDVSSGMETSQMVGGRVPITFLTRDDPEFRNPSTMRCLDVLYPGGGANPAVDSIVECGGREVTVTFDRPTVDPVLWIGTNMVVPVPNVAEGGNCYLTWNDTTVTAVNGRAPGDGQLTLASAAQWMTGFDGTTVTSDFPVDQQSCKYVLDSPRGYAGVRIAGEVTNVTLDLMQVAKITRLGTNPQGPGQTIAQPSMSLTVSADVVDLQVTKQAPATVAAGASLDWEITVSNLSEVGSHGFVVRDAVPDDVTDVELVSAPDGCVLSGRDVSCSVAPAGWAVSPNAGLPTLADLTGGDPLVVGEVLAGGETFGPIRLRATAPVTSGAQVVNTATVAGVDSDPDVTNNSSQVVTTVEDVVWDVAKSVEVSGGAEFASPGDTLTYTVVATSTAGRVEDVVLTDDLSDVLADADVVPGSTTLTVGDAAPLVLPDPSSAAPVVTAGPFTLPAGATATLSYQVVVREGAWSTELVNTVTGDGSTVPQTCSVTAPVADPACSTQTWTTARLDLRKQGQVNGVTTLLPGAEFAVLADQGGTAGDPVPGVTATPVPGTPGTFEIAGIAPGTYWLHEITAPSGYELLATLVSFTVAEDGSVTLLDPDASPQVTVEGGTLTVTDVAAFQMPESGSTGRGPVVVIGLVLLAAAAGIPLLRRLRPGAADTTSSEEGGPRTDS